MDDIVDPFKQDDGIVDPFAPSEKKDMAWGDVAKGAVENAWPSAKKFATDLVQPIIHPIDTAKAIGNVGLGAVEKLIPGGEYPHEKYADAVGRHFAERYGGIENAKKAFAEDPIGVMSDASMVLTGGASAAARLPGTLGKIGRAAGAVGSAIDPVMAPVNAAKAGAELVGGIGTHTGAAPLRTAFEAGAEGGPKSEAFLSNMRGSEPLSNVVDEARGAVGNMAKDRSADYVAGMNQIGKDQTILDWTGIDNAIANSSGVKKFKGVDLSPKTKAVRDEINDTVSAWKKLDPAEYHTPAGFDALKQQIGDIVEHAPYGSPERKIASDAYRAIRQEIVKQAPEYGKVMKNYEEASDLIKEMNQTLSLNPKANIDTTLRKLQSIMRNNVNTNYGRRFELGQMLADAGASTLMEKLSGQALNSWFPRGLGKLGAEAAALGAAGHFLSPQALLAAPFMSPRLMGEAAHFAGNTVGGALRTTGKAFQKLGGSNRLAGDVSYELGRAALEPKQERADGGRVDYEKILKTVRGFADGGMPETATEGPSEDTISAQLARDAAAVRLAKSAATYGRATQYVPPERRPERKDWMIEPGLEEQQTQNFTLPPGAKRNDAGEPFYPDTGEKIRVIPRPGVLPVVKTPEGAQWVMPRVGEAAAFLAPGLSVGAAAKTGEAILGAGAVRRDPNLWHGISSVKLPKPVSEMSADLRPTTDVVEKSLSPEKLQGGLLLPALGDRSVAGADLHGFNGYDFDKAVPMQGGHGFMPINSDSGAVWASGDSVARRIANKAKELGANGTPIYFPYTAMGERSVDFSHHVASSLVEALKQQPVSRAAAKEFDAAMRTPNADYTKPFEDWPGIKSPRLEEYLTANGGDVRNKFAKLMDTSKYQSLGLPSVAEARHAVTDPRLLHAPTGAAGLSVSRLNADGAVLKDVSGHRTYSADLGGKYLGGLGRSVPKEVFYPDLIEAYKKAGYAPHQYDYLMARGLKGAPAAQKADQQWVDTVSKWLAANPKDAMKFAQGGRVDYEKILRDARSFAAGGMPEADDAAAAQDARDAAAARLARGAVSPEGKPSEGPGYAATEAFIPALAKNVGRLVTYPARLAASGAYQPGQSVADTEMKAQERGLESPIDWAGETALNTFGTSAPFAEAGALGSAGGKLAATAPRAERELSPLGLYSHAEEAAAALPQERGTGQQFRAMLDKAGVKPDEFEHTGLGEFLASRGDAPVTRSEIAEHLKNNRVQIGEKVKGLDTRDYFENLDPSEQRRIVSDWEDEVRPTMSPEAFEEEYGNTRWRRNAAEQWHDNKVGDVRDATKYEGYQLPGGENYQERLLTIEGKKPKDFSDWYAKTYPDQLGPDALPAAEKAWMEHLYSMEKNEPYHGRDPFNSPHWDEPNVLAHVRMNDRTMEGKKSLHLEEIQSDWHQQGRKQGYATNDPALKEKAEQARKDYQAILPEIHKMVEENNNFGYRDMPDAMRRMRDQGPDVAFSDATPEQKALAWKAYDAFNDANNLAKEVKGGVPNAPFKTTWHELALKRMLRHAAENGYDRLSWTPGEAQAARYDLSKHVNEVWAKPVGDGKFDLTVTDKSGNPIYDTARTGAVDHAAIAETIGKEFADKISSQTSEHTYSGLDLKIGGEGMKGFYDQIVPKAIEKIGKAHGVKVKQGVVGDGTKSQWSSTETIMNDLGIPEQSQSSYWRNLSQQERDRLIREHQENKHPVHYIDISPEFRAALMKGQKLFASGGAVKPSSAPISKSPALMRTLSAIKRG